MVTPDDIKRIREKMKMTPTEFGAMMGVSASAVCLWEAGRTHPRWHPMVKLNELAEKHGVSLLVPVGRRRLGRG